MNRCAHVQQWHTLNYLKKSYLNITLTNSTSAFNLHIDSMTYMKLWQLMLLIMQVFFYLPYSTKKQQKTLVMVLLINQDGLQFPAVSCWLFCNAMIPQHVKFLRFLCYLSITKIKQPPTTECASQNFTKITLLFLSCTTTLTRTATFSQLLVWICHHTTKIKTT